MIKYRTGYKYQLAFDYSYDTGIKPKEVYNGQFLQIDAQGFLTIKSGYAWDGPSGPTVDGSTNMRASLIHDALYQLMRNSVIHRGNRKAADKIFKKLCKEDGMSSFRANIDYWGLRKFGKINAQAKSIKKIHIAP